MTFGDWPADRGLRPPEAVVIEPTNRCNLSCPLCPRVLGIRLEGMMSYERYLQILDELAGWPAWPRRLDLFNHGEPFLHPRLFDMIRSATDAHLQVHVATNSTLLTPENIDGLLAAPPTSIRVSLDGTTAGVHEAYRHHSDYSACLEGIRTLCQRRRGWGLSLPEVILQFIVTRQNQDQLLDALRLTADLGVDHFVPQVIDLGSWGSQEQRRERARQFLPTIEELGKYTFQDGRLVIKQRPEVCPWASRFAGVILWNGDLAACCFDATGETVMGNVFVAGGYTGLIHSCEFKLAQMRVRARQYRVCSGCQHSEYRIDVGTLVQYAFQPKRPTGNDTGSLTSEIRHGSRAKIS